MEGAIIFCLTAVIGFLLYYNYKKEQDHDHFRLTLMRNAQESFNQYVDLIKARDEKFEKLLDATFGQYLKHIQNLEKMVLPKPVTQKMVQDILDQTPPISRYSDEAQDRFKNTIDEVPEDKVLGPDGKVTDPNAVEINDQTFASIPITRNTKVAFEDTASEMLE